MSSTQCERKLRCRHLRNMAASFGSGRAAGSSSVLITEVTGSKSCSRQPKLVDNTRVLRSSSRSLARRGDLRKTAESTSVVAVYPGGLPCPPIPGCRRTLRSMDLISGVRSESCCANGSRVASAISSRTVAASRIPCAGPADSCPDRSGLERLGLLTALATTDTVGTRPILI